MDRISTAASHTRILNAVFAQQARVNDAQWQVSTGLRCQTYQELRLDAGRLLNLDTARIGFDRLAMTNEAMLRRLDISETALGAIDGAMRDFREVLMTTGGDPLEPEDAKELQDAAFRALSNLEAFLNTQADGRFLYSGSRVTTKPVDLGLSDLAAFQTRYDGLRTHYPPTREANLSANLTLTTAQTGGLIVSGTNTISAADTAIVPAPFSQIDVGATISLDGSGLGNGGSYTVVSNDGYNLVVSGPLAFSPAVALDVQATLVDGNEAAGATLTLSRWYAGDEQATTQRIDEQRDETFDLNAIDPAFEKAIRAFGLIAEGAAGTDGGLANHPERIDWAIDLMNSALERAPSIAPPFGPEQLGNIDDVRRELGFQQSLLHDTAARQNEFVATLAGRIATLRDADVNEASANLLDASNALEAAYAAIAEVRDLSLVNFL